MYKSVKTWLPIKNIFDGIIETKDKRFCKVLEVYPINFSLKSLEEQENILYQYKNFLNSCDFDIQILVQSRRKDLDSHILQVKSNIEKETDEKVIKLMNRYVNMVKEEVVKSAITKRFFIIFFSDLKKDRQAKEHALQELREKTLKIKNTLNSCGNDIKDFESNNKELIDIIYTFMNPNTSEVQKIKEISYEYKS